jgi:hypothetical protein
VSHNYYATRLLFIEGRIGIAKLQGAGKKIVLPPQLPGLEVMEIDYTPEVSVARLREKNQGWRDMEQHEIRAADAFLKGVFA